MGSDFRSEWRSWRAVFSLRKKTIAFFSGIVVFLISLFLVMVWEYQILSSHIAQLTTQVEVIAEIDESLSQEQVTTLQMEIESLPMVHKVDYWSVDRTSQYIDDKILSGYDAFLQKTPSEIPLQPLFRIQLSELDQKDELTKLLLEKYPRQIFLIPALVDADELSFAQQFISQIGQSARVFQISIVLLLIALIGVYGYMVSFLLSERSRGFHLTQMLHLAPPYEFGPAVWIMTGIALMLHFIASVLAYILLGHFLFLLVSSLFLVFFLLNIILVWFGRFVIFRWGMR
jgi:hypothetical protein